MEQTLQQTKEKTSFGEYLNQSRENMFVLDLSNCSLIECVDKMCEVKVKTHPNIKKIQVADQQDKGYREAVQL